MNLKVNYHKQKDIKLEFSNRNKSYFIDIESIAYLQCDGYLTTMHLLSDETIKISKLLKHFENALSEHDFKRVNRSTLVNLKHVKSIKVEKGNKTIKIKDVEIKVSRRKSILFNPNNNY